MSPRRRSSGLRDRPAAASGGSVHGPPPFSVLSGSWVTKTSRWGPRASQRGKILRGKRPEFFGNSQVLRSPTLGVLKRGASAEGFACKAPRDSAGWKRCQQPRVNAVRCLRAGHAGANWSQPWAPLSGRGTGRASGEEAEPGQEPGVVS